MRRSAPTVLLALTLTLSPTSTEAQEQDSGGARILRASRVADSQMELDGRFDEAAWSAAAVTSDFTQRDPDDGSPSTERTEVRVLFSESAIYVAVRAFDSEPQGIRSVLSRRDVSLPSDRIAVLFDSYDDRRTSFRFAVTPNGAIRDVAHVDDFEGGDASWDPVWDVATTVDDQGWTAEFRIPFTQLRFDAERTAWGFQVYRRVERKAEDSWWAPYSKEGSGFASRFGRLEGLAGLPSPKRLEIRPYTIADSRFRPEGTGTVYAPSHSMGVDAGLDLKFGVTSDFTLDLTANPDFGQVEADPAVVNLSAFETFLPERRPFFIEGGNLLPTQQMFYSRRIGRSPQGSASAPTGGTVESPDEATILSAAKLTGKSGTGLGLGVMSAVTSGERATLRDGSGIVIGSAPVEPLTHYFAGRASQDFSAGNHTIGLSATAVNRRLQDDFPTLRSAAYVGSLNGGHRWRNNAYYMSWSIGASHIRGSRQAITAAQRSSLRYFQRPDADYLEVDSTRTTLSGYTLSLDGGKQAGSLRFYGGYWLNSPGFEANDMGFHGAVDQQMVYGGGQFVRNQPVGVFRSFSFGPDANSMWTTGGEVEFTWVRPFIFNATFRNNWTFGFNPMAFQWNQLFHSALRGGPALASDTWHNSFINVGSDSRKPVSVFLNANLGGVFDQDAKFWGVNTSWSLRASNTLNANVGISYNQRRDPQEWVGRRVVADSAHYILSDIQQQTLSITTRADWTLSPKLSVQLYAQPFVSGGTYDNFKEVVQPRADEIGDRFRSYGNRLSCDQETCGVDLNRDGTTDFSFAEPDFNSTSLRSTMILRWEYRPGSVLFVGWQHGRSRFVSEGTFRAGSDLIDLMSLPSQNTLLVKLNYWLSF